MEGDGGDIDDGRPAKTLPIGEGAFHVARSAAGGAAGSSSDASAAAALACPELCISSDVASHPGAHLACTLPTFHQQRQQQQRSQWRQQQQQQQQQQRQQQRQRSHRQQGSGSGAVGEASEPVPRFEPAEPAELPVSSPRAERRRDESVSIEGEMEGLRAQSLRSPADGANGSVKYVNGAGSYGSDAAAAAKGGSRWSSDASAGRGRR